MKTLLTSVTHYKILVNLDNVTYISQDINNNSIIYFIDGNFAEVTDDFNTLVEKLHEQS